MFHGWPMKRNSFPKHFEHARKKENNNNFLYPFPKNRIFLKVPSERDKQLLKITSVRTSLIGIFDGSDISYIKCKNFFIFRPLIKNE